MTRWTGVLVCPSLSWSRQAQSNDTVVSESVLVIQAQRGGLDCSSPLVVVGEVQAGARPLVVGRPRGPCCRTGVRLARRRHLRSGKRGGPITQFDSPTARGADALRQSQ